jgi:hypothetical protein
MSQRNSLKFGNNNEFMAFVARNVDVKNKQVFVDESYPDAKPIAEVLAAIGESGYVGGFDDNEEFNQSLEAINSAEILNNTKLSVEVSNKNY